MIYLLTLLLPPTLQEQVYTLNCGVYSLLARPIQGIYFFYTLMMKKTIESIYQWLKRFLIVCPSIKNVMEAGPAVVAGNINCEGLTKL